MSLLGKTILSRGLVAACKSSQVQSVRCFTYPESIKRWAYNTSGFNQYGLYHNDLYSETPDVEEAIRRLSPQLQDERTFRIQRAMQLSLMKTILPKDEWVTYEEDRSKGRYLDNILAEVRAEIAEREEWAKKA